MSAQKTAETIHRTGNLREVVPAEKEAAFIAADPLAGDMHVFEGPANDAREATIVQRLLEGGPLSVIVLGLPVQNPLRTELSTGRRDSGRPAATPKLTATVARVGGGQWRGRLG